MERDVYFSLGSNIGDRKKNLYDALDRMDGIFGERVMSSVIETEPWGFSADTSFLNCAVMYRTGRDCMDILEICKSIEAGMGRDVSGPLAGEDGRRVYSSRIIDIDILFYGTETVCEEGLSVPHPLMADRDFVMIPLSEIAKPDVREAFPWIFSGKS